MHPGGGIEGGSMKKLTTTTATCRGIAISVWSERFEGKTMFCCENTLSGSVAEDKWFATQGEAIANARQEIDRRMGMTR
jgi:hypothetical protein